MLHLAEVGSHDPRAPLPLLWCSVACQNIVTTPCVCWTCALRMSASVLRQKSACFQDSEASVLPSSVAVLLLLPPDIMLPPLPLRIFMSMIGWPPAEGHTRGADAVGTPPTGPQAGAPPADALQGCAHIDGGAGIGAAGSRAASTPLLPPLRPLSCCPDPAPDCHDCRWPSLRSPPDSVLRRGSPCRCSVCSQATLRVCRSVHHPLSVHWAVGSQCQSEPNSIETESVLDNTGCPRPLHRPATTYWPAPFHQHRQAVSARVQVWSARQARTVRMPRLPSWVRQSRCCRATCPIGTGSAAAPG